MSVDKPENSIAARVTGALAHGTELLGYRAVQYVLGFLTGLVIARALGPSGRAEFALPLAYATTVLVAAHMSIELAITRLLSRDEATPTELTRLAVTMGCVLGPLAATVGYALGHLFPEAVVGVGGNTTLALACAVIVPSMAGQFLASILFRVGRTREYGALQAVAAAGQLGLIAILAATDDLDPSTVLLAQLVLASGIAVALAIVLGRHLSWTALRPAIDRPLIEKSLRIGAVLHPSSLALYLNLRLDLFLVAALLGNHEAGLYSLAATLGELILVGAATIGLAALRDQAELSETDSVEYTVGFARQSLGIAAVLAVAVAAVSYPLLVLAYGSDWSGAAAPLALLAFASVALAVEGPVRGLLFRLGRPAAISLAAIAGMAANVILCLVLIPPLGLVGAAGSSVASYSVIAFLMLLQLRRRTGIQIRAVLRPPLPGDFVLEAPRRLASALSLSSGRGTQA